MSYRGIIIEESLREPSVLDDVKILSTEIEQVTEGFKTPWLKQWTLRTVDIADDRARDFAEHIATAIDVQHAASWFADFSNETNHYIIFSNIVFLIDKSRPEEYEAARQYGLSIGIPDHQLKGFMPQS